jgi:hypothetical protein
MARRVAVKRPAKPKAKEAEPKVSKPKAKAKKPKAKVVVKEVDTRRLVTVDPEHQLWKDVQDGIELVQGTAPTTDLSGAIARVRPPPGASKEHVDKVCTYLREAGCEIVRPEPAEPSADELPEQARASAKVGTHREIVLDLASKARTRDRQALEHLLEEVMGEEGL